MYITKKQPSTAGGGGISISQKATGVRVGYCKRSCLEKDACGGGKKKLKSRMVRKNNIRIDTKKKTAEKEKKEVWDPCT